MKRGIPMRKIIPFIVLLLLASCGQNNGHPETQFVLIHSSDNQLVANDNSQSNDDLLQGIEEVVNLFDEIFNVVIVKGKEDILVTYKVHHMQRFRMKKIERELLKKLETKFPNEQMAVSSDYKIFLEATSLQKKLMDPNFSPVEAEKRLKKIIKLKNELT